MQLPIHRIFVDEILFIFINTQYSEGQESGITDNGGTLCQSNISVGNKRGLSQRGGLR
jgi:hypothetical protein